jgi:uncharacterized protein YukE
VKPTSEDIRSDWQRFQTEWENVRASWKDEVAESFDRRFLAPWDAQLPALLRVLEDLENATREAERTGS